MAAYPAGRYGRTESILTFLSISIYVNLVQVRDLNPDPADMTACSNQLSYTGGNPLKPLLSISAARHWDHDLVMPDQRIAGADIGYRAG